MSKITNILNMYRLLLESTCISPKDIANELELSVRQVKTYKSDMINAGIPIKTKKGRGGGYYIDMFYDTSFKMSHIDDDVLMDSINTHRYDSQPWQRLTDRQTAHPIMPAQLMHQ